jgi:hypothetical protein
MPGTASAVISGFAPATVCSPNENNPYDWWLKAASAALINGSFTLSGSADAGWSSGAIDLTGALNLYDDGECTEYSLAASANMAITVTCAAGLISAEVYIIAYDPVETAGQYAYTGSATLLPIGEPMAIPLTWIGSTFGDLEVFTPGVLTLTFP